MNPDDELAKSVLPAAAEDTVDPENDSKSIDISVMEVGFEVETPGGEMVCLFPVSTQEVILSLKMLLQELPETCQYTCYYFLTPNGTELNDFVEIREYLQKGVLSSGMKLKMEEEEYTVRQVRQHVRKIRELLLYPIGYPEQNFEQASAEMKEVLKMVEAKEINSIMTQEPFDDTSEQAQLNGKETEPSTNDSDDAKLLEEGNPQENGNMNGNADPLDDTAIENEASAKEIEVLRRQKLMKHAKVQLKELRDRIPEIDVPVPVNLSDFYEVVVGGISSVGETNLKDMLQGGFARKDGGPAGGLAVSPMPCLKGLCFSGWNPPPGPRRLMGDLAYLEVSTLDDGILHITATPFGFYVNRTSHVTFDPLPAANPCHSHSLMPLLEQASPSFRKAWAHARQQATQRNREAQGPLDVLALMVGEGRIDALTGCPQWNVASKAKPTAKPGITRHKLDLNRMEEDLLNTFGMDERGALRDWNEEYQSAVELPELNLEERLIKTRALHKILSDFHEAALQGAKAIVERQVAPLNPMEAEATHVYAFNNIFFSYALDSRQAYQTTGGDVAAYKNANHDLRNVVALNKARLPGLSTLATSVVDFLGVRLVAQSIIPGILTGDHRDKLVFGAVEYGLPLVKKDEKLAEYIKQVADRFLIAERTLPMIPIPGCISEATLEAMEAEEAKNKQADQAPAEGSPQEGSESGQADVPPPPPSAGEEEEEGEENKTVDLCSAVEVKGIQGADGRRYLLDVVRVSPRDANWVPKTKNGTGVYPSNFDDGGEEFYTAVLRSELVIRWAREKVTLWSSEKRQAMLKEKKKEKEEEEKTKAAAAEDGGNGENNETNDGENPPKMNPNDYNLSEEEGKRLKNMTEEYVKMLALNVNVFMPYVASVDAEEIARDEEAVKEASLYLWNHILPNVIVDVKRGVLSNIVDGKSLTETLHSHGVNVRYLGRLAALAQQEEAEDVKMLAEGMVRRHHMPIWWLEIVEIEIIARALKHVIFDLTKDRPDIRILPGPTLLRMLNCLLGNPLGEKKKEALKTIEIVGSPLIKPKKQKGKGKRSASKSPTTVAGSVPVLDFNHTALWELLAKKIKERFRYILLLWKDAGWMEGQSHPRALRAPLLRRVCQRLGLRVASRDYNWENGCPFSNEDLIDVTPVPKHCLPYTPIPEASQQLEIARLHLATGNLGLAFELTQSAIAQLQMVCGGTHREVAAALELSSMIFFHAHDTDACMAQGQKALAFYDQLLGFDSPQSIACQGNLAVLLASSTRSDKAIAHLKAYLYLVELSAGPHHPEVTSAYQRMGAIFQEVGNLKMAMKCYNELLRRDVCDKPTQAHTWHNMALILHQAGEFENAIASERSSYTILKGLYGEKDGRTQESQIYVKRFTEAAIQHKQQIDAQNLASIAEKSEKLAAKKGKANNKGKKKKKN